MSVTEKEIISLNTEQVNLYVLGEVLYNLSDLDFPIMFKDRIDKLKIDIFNFLFPVSKKYKDYDALEQKWSITTYYTKGKNNAGL